jgi:hypothetical protein
MLTGRSSRPGSFKGFKVSYPKGTCGFKKVKMDNLLSSLMPWQESLSGFKVTGPKGTCGLCKVKNFNF